MKIDLHPVGPVDRSQERRTHPVSSSPSGQTERTQTEGTAQAPDLTRLSVDRERIEKLSSSLTQLPDIRQDRVDAIQKALFNGTFSVSNEQIAESVLTELLGEILSGR